MEKILVSADGAKSYEAMVDKSHRWNGWLVPRFTLDTVKRIAADLKRQNKKSGYDHAEEIRVVEAPGLTGYPEGTDEVNSDPLPGVVVIQISWMRVFTHGPDECTRVITPDANGLYSIGSGWTWHEVTSPVDEVHWPTFADEFAQCALREALWWEVDPDPSGVGGDEWEAVEFLGVADIASDLARERWMQMCCEYVEINKEHLATLSSDLAGQMFWQSKRDGRGSVERDFLHADGIPEKSRRRLHTTAGRWPVGHLFLRDNKIHFDL